MNDLRLGPIDQLEHEQVLNLGGAASVRIQDIANARGSDALELAFELPEEGREVRMHVEAKAGRQVIGVEDYGAVRLTRGDPCHAQCHKACQPVAFVTQAERRTRGLEWGAPLRAGYRVLHLEDAAAMADAGCRLAFRVEFRCPRLLRRQAEIDNAFRGALCRLVGRRVVGAIWDREGRAVGQPAFGCGETDGASGKKSGIELEATEPPGMPDEACKRLLDIGLDPAILLLEMLRSEEHALRP